MALSYKKVSWIGIFRQGIYKEEKCPLLTSNDERIEINLEKRSNGCSGITDMYADVYVLFHTTQKAELLLAKS